MKQIFIIQMLVINFLFLSVLSLFAQTQVGINWEFNEDENLQGWIASPNFSNVEVKDSVLSATASGPFPYLESEGFNIAASEYKFIYIRMKLPGANTAKIMWDNDSGEWGFHWFPVKGDTAYHEYQLPVFLNEQWKGQITKIRKLDFNPPLNSQIGIDYIRIVRIGPVPEIVSFTPLRTVIKQGHEIPLTSIVQNNGDTEVEMKSILTIPEGITFLNGDLENTHGTLFREIADTIHWRVKCDNIGDFDLSLSLYSDSDTTEKKLTLSVTDEYWEPGEFLLSAWSPPYAWYPAPYDDAIFEDYFAANFDIVLWLRPDENLIAKVENFNKKYFLLVTNLVGGDLYLRAPDKQIPPDITPEMLSNLDGLVEQYKNNPNVIGYHICDEPHTQAFENIGKVVSYLRKKDPKRLSFINIWPGTGNTEYKNYIKELLEKTKLEILSYDRYVFFNDRTDQNIFFNNLRVIRESAMAYDIPFCNIIQAIGTNGSRESHLDWRTPSEAEHRWQVYASLAYGAKGIIWFHWHLDWGVTGSPDCEQIKASIALTNAEINALGPIMIGLNTMSVYHSKNVPFGEVAMPVDALVKSVSSNADLVIGFFKDKNDCDYMMLMNKNFRDSVTATITMNYSLNGLQAFNTDSISWETVDFNNASNGAEFECILVAGGGRLYKLDLANPAGVQMENNIPTHFRLNQNYPNPFNPITSIEYELKKSCFVNLSVYDLLGKKVVNLVDQKQNAGTHEIKWFAENLTSGVYFYQLRAGDEEITRKMLLLH